MADESYDALELLRRMLADEVRFGDFTLASGAKSDWYLDCRPITFSHPNLIGEALWAWRYRGRAPHDHRMDSPLWQIPSCWGGVIAGGMAIATAAAVRFRRPAVGIRPDPKDHGAGGCVHGSTHAHQHSETLALVDDVFTSGGSLERATYRLAEANWPEPEAYLVLFNRGEDQERKTFMGKPFYALFNIADIVTRPGE